MSTSRRDPRSTNRTDPVRAARLQRDAATERVRSVTKGIAFASVAAVAVGGVYLSQAIPGHAATSTPTTSGSSGAVAPTGDDSSSGDDYGTGGGSSAPSAPAAAPAPAYNQQPVVSSGSS
jgi:hypothetical protein